MERIELLSLVNLMATDDPLPPAGPAPSSRRALSATVTSGGGFVGAELRMVCARGLVVACKTPLVAGERTIVRIADESGGVEYVVPCVVEWSHPGSGGSMALCVDGAPARSGTMERGPLGREALAWPATIDWAIEPGAAA
jgi:hypothetical protein